MLFSLNILYVHIKNNRLESVSVIHCCMTNHPEYICLNPQIIASLASVVDGIVVFLVSPGLTHVASGT